MIGDGHGIDRRRHDKIDNAADIEIAERLRRGRAVGGQHREYLAIAAAVRRRGDQPLAIVQPGQQAIAHAVGLAMLRYGAFPVVEGEGLAARRDRQARPVGTERGAVQEPLRRHEAAVALRA